MVVLLLDFIYIAPLLSGFLLPLPEISPAVLHNIVNLCLLLFCWAILRRIIPWFLNRQGAAFWRGLALLIASFAVVAALEITRLRLPADLVGLTLFILGSLALEQALTERKKYWFAIIVFTIAMGALAMLGFELVGESLRWQPLLFAISLSLAAACSEIARKFELFRPQNYAAKTFAALFLLAPTLIALLAYTRQLPVYYISAYALLILTPWTISPLLAGAQKASRPALFVFPAFLAILILLKISLGT